MRADWLKIVFPLLDRNTELVRAVYLMMARAKGIYILLIKVNMLFFFFSSRWFLKEIENMFFVFPSSYRNTCESLGELEKPVETLACGPCSHSISRSPNFHSCFYLANRFHIAVRLFSNRSQMTSKCGKNKQVAQTSVLDCVCLLDFCRFQTVKS